MSTKIKLPVSSGVAKVPVVMQMEALECGAACLTMVLAYYNKWVPLEQVRTDCGVSKDGSKAKNIMKAARAYGLSARGFKAEPEVLKKSALFPCIIHWNFEHFVVLRGFRGDKVYINDPDRGSCTVSMEEFDESFTGVCMMFEPSEAFEPGGKPKNMLAFAKKNLSGSKAAVVFVVLTTVIAALLNIADPLFSRVLADELLTGQNLAWLKPFILLLAGVSLIEIIVAWIQDIYTLKIAGKMAAVGNASYMWKVFRMPIAFFSQRQSGDILLRKEANASIAAELTDTIAPLIINFAMMIFYLIVMMKASVVLSLIGIFSVALNILISEIITAKRINTTRGRLRDESKLAAATVNGIEMIETIKASGSENGYFEKWSGFQAAVNEHNVRFIKIDQYLGIIPEIISEITNLIILGIGIYLTMKGQFTLGLIMAFQGFLESFTAPAMTLTGALETFQEMSVQMERIEDVMDAPIDESYEAEVEDSSESLEKLKGNVELSHVTFGYSPLEEPLIRDFSMSIPAGSRVAFVGMSGCGKSTISKLVAGLYHPWSGEILYDGKPQSKIDRDVFTGSIAVVDQDIILFEDTIENNIKMWDRSIEDFEMILAARDAQLHEDIMQREGGYHYKIAEGGSDFSGGQRQRLEIARVLAQDPSMIILDEATSALDARTEYDVVNAIKARGITCIVVAHRLSTIRDCDEIIVLDHGEVLERGTHDELMAADGAYVRLVTNN